MARNTKTKATPKRSQGSFWQGQIDSANKRFMDFETDATNTVQRYRLENTNSKSVWKDKYNILYSSTETMKPSLYAQTPKVQITKRHRDRESVPLTLAILLLEVSTQYAMEDMDFDDVMANVVEDYMLAGMGVAWIRYIADIETIKDGETEYEQVGFEGLDLEYVHYKDFRCSAGRTWKDIWWIARRVYMFKADVAARFGEDAANSLTYDKSQGEGKPDDGDGQATIWEIWNKRDKKVLWYSSDTKDEGVLDVKDDPLKLKDFYPCPRPLRAISTTGTFVPINFYSQYRQQADTLDKITEKIRILTDALKVVGLYDTSQQGLSSILAGNNNKMVPVDNWTQFATNGGMSGSVQFLPIKEVAAVLTELYRQREIAKNEIYEITGFSDITRGLSKASETLGAQQIKNQWAGGRLQVLQKDVQRFCRDIIRIIAEIISENFSDENLMMYAGVDLPEVTPEEQQQAAQYAAQAIAAREQGQEVGAPPTTKRQQAEQQFQEVVGFLRKERTRMASIGIETDSTIQPDEVQERKDRMEFLGAIGAYLQQAGPMAMQYPDMRGLLGAIMMFAARTFKASRPIEQEFEQFAKTLESNPPAPPPGEGEQGDGGKGAIETAQIKAQADTQKAAGDAEIKKYEIDAKMQLEREKLQAQQSTKDRELALREREVRVKEAELGLRQDEQEFEQDAALEAGERQDRQFEAQRDDNRDAKKDVAGA